MGSNLVSHTRMYTSILYSGATNDNQVDWTRDAAAKMCEQGILNISNLPHVQVGILSFTVCRLVPALLWNLVVTSNTRLSLVIQGKCQHIACQLSAER